MDLGDSSAIDLSGSLAKAQRAARRGDLDALEIELSQLRNLPADSVGSIGMRFRALARSVRSHPSFSATPHAQAV